MTASFVSTRDFIFAFLPRIAATCLPPGCVASLTNVPPRCPLLCTPPPSLHNNLEQALHGSLKTRALPYKLASAM